MKAIYQKALANSLAYNDYLTLIDEKIAQEASTGHEQNQMLTDFTKLNRARMKRLDKTQQILPELEIITKQITEKQVWLVLTESWCGDAAQNVPVLKKLAEMNPQIDLRMALRDDNDELMQKYLTNGGKSIPKLIAVSADLEKELFTWGPRPAAAQVEVKRLLDENGGFNEKVKEGIQIWYNHDKGISMQQELIDLLKNATN
ncbi:thioredoxin family protein [Paenimyroides aestuarii]|uniref:Thioredoxin family protein n=1 Tax=Paenimyroides aestuarii TaxID=2968490 RepID=A0ABY5NTQ8_9FLAO|nr:thioredoxin family protein [Paenimyroides aestuarii]UUV21823.1 thioredoxin family protein [Paenimyroides aestuarii]